MPGYPCDGPSCGCCCCREVMKPAGIENLCGPDARGTCVHYDPTVGCTIYATRPDVCSVDKVYYFHGFSDRMPRSVYYGVSRALCQKLQREAGWTRPDKK